MSERSVELFYQGDVPAWRIVVPQPDRFRGVEYDIRFQLFVLRGGTLVGCWLRLYDVEDQPYFIHRVLDLGDPVVQEYMEGLSERGRMILVFESTGQGEGFSQEVGVEKVGLPELVEEGREWIRKGYDGDGEKALDQFMDVFNGALQERGDVGQAWEAVMEKHPQPAA